MWTKDEMARRAADEISDGDVVNLGIGLPTLVANHISDGREVWLHSENGLLGMGPFPYEGDEDPQLINAGKQTVTIVPGGSIFDSATSFTMIRGGHVDVVMLGAMQVSATGDLANWAIPGGRTMGIGGAMDLATGARRIVVVTRHQTKKGKPKMLAECTFPLTAEGSVDRVVTDMGVFEPGSGESEGAFVAIELADGVSLDDVRDATAADVVDARA